MDHLEPYLTKLFLQDGIQFTCNGWRRLFRMLESVYEALCMEFFSMLNFRKKEDFMDPENFTFCLGEQRREISLCELMWRLDVYSRSDALYPEFVFILDHCHKRLPKGSQSRDIGPK